MYNLNVLEKLRGLILIKESKIVYGYDWKVQIKLGQYQYDGIVNQLSC